MYFANAIWYMFSTLGFASIIFFVVVIFAIFDPENVEREIGYTNYFIIMGTYTLIAMPLAATLNGGTGRDFLFFLGCECPALIVISNQLESRYKARRAQLLAMQPQLQSAVTAPPPLDHGLCAIPDVQDQRPYAPASSSLLHDFDVPPQR